MRPSPPSLILLACACVAVLGTACKRDPVPSAAGGDPGPEPVDTVDPEDGADGVGTEVSADFDLPLDGEPDASEPDPSVECTSNSDCGGLVTACSEAICDQEAGKCKQVPVAGTPSCDDKDPCTNGDVCVGGACAGVEKTCPPEGQCFAEGSCDPTDGTCLPKPLNAGDDCNDGSACTSDEACDGNGVCAGEPTFCDDGNPCTKDSCDPGTGACTTENAPAGTACSSPIPCPTSDGCVAGICGCQCPGGGAVTMLMDGMPTVQVMGAVAIKSSKGDTLKVLGCPDDWGPGGGEVLVEPSESLWTNGFTPAPRTLEWWRPCPPTNDPIETLFNDGGGSLWNAVFVGATKLATFSVKDGAGTTVADWNVFGVHVLEVVPPNAECSDAQKVTLGINPVTTGRLILELQGVTAGTWLGQIRLLDLPNGKANTPPIFSIEEWKDSYLPGIGAPPGAPKDGTVQITNPCGDEGTRFFFGDESLETFHDAWSGQDSGKSGSIILTDEYGAEIQRINLYGVAPESYSPGYKECVIEEVLHWHAGAMEKG